MPIEGGVISACTVTWLLDALAAVQERYTAVTLWV